MFGAEPSKLYFVEIIQGKLVLLLINLNGNHIKKIFQVIQIVSCIWARTLVFPCFLACLGYLQSKHSYQFFWTRFVQGHLHTYRFCVNVCTFFILQDATFKNEDTQHTVGRVKIVACDTKLFTQWAVLHPSLFLFSVTPHKSWIRCRDLGFWSTVSSPDISKTTCGYMII